MNLQRFADRVAVVTGGASPIGFGIAERLAVEGAHVVLGDFDSERLTTAGAKLEATVPGRFHTVLVPRQATFCR
jgi:2,3-dihydroxy-2,3-dihydro-p-cumate dehydrogenase